MSNMNKISREKFSNMWKKFIYTMFGKKEKWEERKGSTKKWRKKINGCLVEEKVEKREKWIKTKNKARFAKTFSSQIGEKKWEKLDGLKFIKMTLTFVRQLDVILFYFFGNPNWMHFSGSNVYSRENALLSNSYSRGKSKGFSTIEFWRCKIDFWGILFLVFQIRIIS